MIFLIGYRCLRPSIWKLFFSRHAAGAVGFCVDVGAPVAQILRMRLFGRDPDTGAREPLPRARLAFRPNCYGCYLPR